MASRIPKIYNFAGKRSGSSDTEDDDLAVVTNAAADGTGSESPTPVVDQNNAGPLPRLPNLGTFDDDEKVLNVCKYSKKNYFMHMHDANFTCLTLQTHTINRMTPVVQMTTSS